MSEFQAYTDPYIPTELAELSFTVESNMEDVIDPETGLPTGDRVLVEKIGAKAVVRDQNGVERWRHIAYDHVILLENEVLNVDELLAVQQWLQARRATLETLLLAGE